MSYVGKSQACCDVSNFCRTSAVRGTYSQFLGAPLPSSQPETLQPDGCGSMLYRDSCLYDGQWRNGLRHGAAVLTIPVGVLRGVGSSTCVNEAGAVTVDGQWRDGAPDGDAEWSVTFPNGDKYLGNLKFPITCDDRAGGSVEDKDFEQMAIAEIVPHGWGLSKRKDTGEVYEGHWIDGMRHGSGVSQAQI